MNIAAFLLPTVGMTKHTITHFVKDEQGELHPFTITNYIRGLQYEHILRSPKCWNGCKH